MTRILRYEVPVDDQYHEFDLRGDVLAVGCRQPTVAEFWATHSDDAPTVTRRFLVVGTGHPMPDNAAHRGTATAPGGHLVWHLLEVAGGGV